MGQLLRHEYLFWYRKISIFNKVKHFSFRFLIATPNSDFSLFLYVFYTKIQFFSCSEMSEHLTRLINCWNSILLKKILWIFLEMEQGRWKSLSESTDGWNGWSNNRRFWADRSVRIGYPPPFERHQGTVAFVH